MRSFDGIDNARKLRILAQVVECGSFKKAALRAKISAPAISQSISALEKIVGKPLVSRENGRVVPTEIALTLLREATPAIEKLSCLLGGGNQRTPTISWIELGAYESLAVGLLPRLIPRLEKRLPGVKLTVRVARSTALATLIRKGELCAALVTENETLGGLLSEPLAEDRLGFFVSAQLPEQDRSWASVIRGKIGTLSPCGSEGYPRYYQKFIAATVGSTFKPSFLSDSLEALRSVAVRGAIHAVLPARVAQRFPGELIEVSPPGLEEKNLGAHQILLISQKNCDPTEVSILTEVIKPLF